MGFTYCATPLLAVSALGLASASGSCYSSALNTTQTTYTISEIENVATIAKMYSRGVCDAARASLMSDPSIPFAAGMSVIIPAEVCDPDDTTCITVADPDATNFCLMGGPHLYYTQRNDTYRTVAIERFNISLETVLTALGVDESQADVVLAESQFVKIPSCYPSQCILQPYKFTYGTYKDLADKFGASMGPIIAYNPTYSHSVAETGEGSVLIVPMNCTALPDTVVAMT